MKFPQPFSLVPLGRGAGGVGGGTEAPNRARAGGEGCGVTESERLQRLHIMI
jgi:hypothetical protein